MAWIGVITNKGKELLGRWNEENVLKITGAAAGTGTISEVALIAQEALVDEKQVMKITNEASTGSGKRITLRLTSEEVDATYICTQVALYAGINDEDPVLFAIYQNVEGQEIPAYEETADFVWTYYAVIEVNNNAAITVIIDPETVITVGDEMTAEEAAQIYEEIAGGVV